MIKLKAQVNAVQVPFNHSPGIHTEKNSDIATNSTVATINKKNENFLLLFQGSLCSGCSDNEFHEVTREVNEEQK